VVRGNGFSLGTATLTYRPGASSNTPGTTGASTISFGGILELDDITIGISGLTVVFDGSNPFADFTGEVFIATSGAKLFPGKPFGATITDRKTSDDRLTNGLEDTDAIRIGLTFTRGRVDAFQMRIDTLEVRLGSFVTLTARDFRLDTGAVGTTNELVSFAAVGAKVTVGSLELAGEGRNFAFLGNGAFKAKPGFGVFLSVGSATGDSFKWPTFLPVRIDAIGVSWNDIENAPEDFVLTLSASVTGIKGLSGLEFTGSVQGIQIAPALLAKGQFPIIGIDSLGVTVKGAMFGGQIEAGLVGGILKLDSAFNVIGTFDRTTPVAHRVFYAGLQGSFSMAGMAGFGIRLGISELGPLQVFINVALPGGILLEPNTGLTINDFVAGVEFFKSLPSIDDPMQLRGPDFGLPTNLTADQWLASLQQQVAAQARRLDGTDPGEAFLAAFTSPMTITGSARLYSMYTSQAVFNGQVILKISTDGKFLIIGKLNFADDSISMSARLYADLSKVTSGGVTVLFLADIPDQVRLLTIYGKLKMGFKDSTGAPIGITPRRCRRRPAPRRRRPPPWSARPPPAAASTPGPPTASAPSTSSTRRPPVPCWTSTGCSRSPRVPTVQVAVVNGTGASRTVGSPVPIVTVVVQGGVVLAPLRVIGTGASRTVVYSYKVTPTSLIASCDPATNVPEQPQCVEVVVYRASSHSSPAGATTEQLLAAGAKALDITRFRYVLSGAPAGTAVLPLGVVRVSFAAGAFKNADLTTSTGTTAGAGNAVLDLRFTVQGITAGTSDPGPGAGIDVHQINNRNWIDVDLPVPTGRTLDIASVTDAAPEFTLSGPGLGTITLDGTRPPVLLLSAPSGTTATFRYWLTGTFVAGDVTVTLLPGTWSYVAAPVPAASYLPTIAVSGATTPGSLTVTFANLSGGRSTRRR
jgi:hypothetical protein